MAALALIRKEHVTVVRRSILLALFSYGSFATADAFIKSASDTLPVSQIAFFVAIFAFLPALVLTIGKGGVRALWPQKKALVLLRAVLAVACTFSAWNAFTRLPLADAYALLFAAPLLVTALSVPLLGEVVGWRRWTAALVGFAGLLIMIRPGFATFELGHMLAALAALLGAFGFIVLRRIGPAEKSAAVLAPFLAVLATVSGFMMIGEMQPLTAETLAALALAGLLIGSGQAGLVLATREVPAVLIAPFQYTQMVWAIVFGIMIFGDVPDAMLLTGLAIVVMSGLYTLWRETVRKRPATLGAARAETIARASR